MAALVKGVIAFFERFLSFVKKEYRAEVQVRFTRNETELSRIKMVCVSLCVGSVYVDSVGESLETFRRPELLIKVKQNTFCPLSLPLPNISIK